MCAHRCVRSTTSNCIALLESMKPHFLQTRRTTKEVSAINPYSIFRMRTVIELSGEFNKFFVVLRSSSCASLIDPIDTVFRMFSFLLNRPDSDSERVLRSNSFALILSLSLKDPKFRCHQIVSIRSLRLEHFERSIGLHPVSGGCRNRVRLLGDL